MSDYEKVMKTLSEIPGVEEYVTSFTASLGRKLFSCRVQKGLTQGELAILADVPKSVIARIEGGDPSIEGELYNKIFKALGIPDVTFVF